MAVGTSGEATAMAWTVPEQGGDKAEKEEPETREMRVRRYKEKRHNRLFAKKIRYEVRKLNAEKRPRLKVPIASNFSFIIKIQIYFKTRKNEIKMYKILIS